MPMNPGAAAYSLADIAPRMIKALGNTPVGAGNAIVAWLVSLLSLTQTARDIPGSRAE